MLLIDFIHFLPIPMHLRCATNFLQTNTGYLLTFVIVMGFHQIIVVMNDVKRHTYIRQVIYNKQRTSQKLQTCLKNYRHIVKFTNNRIIELKRIYFDSLKYVVYMVWFHLNTYKMKVTNSFLTFWMEMWGHY